MSCLAPIPRTYDGRKFGYHPATVKYNGANS